MQNLSMGILAHVDAGKTTLTEAMLYTSGVVRKLASVIRFRYCHRSCRISPEDTDEKQRSGTAGYPQQPLHRIERGQFHSREGCCQQCGQHKKRQKSRDHGGEAQHGSFLRAADCCFRVQYQYNHAGSCRCAI